MAVFDLHTVDYCREDPNCPKTKLPCLQKVNVSINEIIGFPNPAQNTYTLSWQGTDVKTAYQFTVYNNLGNLMLQGTQATGEAYTIDVSQWQDGLYIVKVQGGEQTQYIKFVVQKGNVAN